MKLEMSVINLPFNYTGALQNQIDDFPRNKEDFLNRRKDICLPKESIDRLINCIDEENFLELVQFRVAAGR